jgi:outer membrane protein assembly factor BamD
MLAENSILAKKPERYQTAVDEYYTLIAEYPQTGYLKEAQKIFENSTEKLKN